MEVTKPIYHNQDFQKVAQLLNARKHNVTTAERTALAAMLGIENEGLFVWDTDEKRGYTWNGMMFQPEAVEIAGDVIFKGVITDLSDPENVEPVSGYEYVIGTVGTLTVAGVTFIPSAVVEIGDRVLFTSATEAYIQQRNDEQATLDKLGNVRLASQAEVSAGVDELKALTPKTLAGALVANKYVKQYFDTVDVPADLTGATVTHGLNLNDAAAFQVNTVDSAGNQVSLEVDAVNANSLRLRSLVALTGIKVTVQGASTVYIGV